MIGPIVALNKTTPFSRQPSGNASATSNLSTQRGQSMKNTGSTKTVYHGSKSEFEQFDKKAIATGGSDGILQYGHGFYFTNNKELAKGFGLHVKEAHLVINNPLNMEAVPDKLTNWMRDTFPSINNFDDHEFKMKVGTVHRILQFLQNAHYNTADVLKELGYDGVVEYHPYADTYVVFDPEQINVLNREPMRLDAHPKDEPSLANINPSEQQQQHNHGNGSEIHHSSRPRR